MRSRRSRRSLKVSHTQTINYLLIYEAITPKSNPIQAINPMNLHTKFQKARLNSIP